MTPRVLFWLALPLLAALPVLTAAAPPSRDASAPSHAMPIQAAAAAPQPPTTSAPAPDFAATDATAFASTGEDFPGVFVTPLRYGEDADFPEDVALVVETGCWACDGPTTGLYRVYRPLGGAVQVDTLFGPGSFGGATITSYAMRPDASEIVVAVCTRGYCGPLGDPSTGAQATFYYSGDGGLSWTSLGTRGDALYVSAVTDDGILLNTTWGSARTLAINGRPAVTDARAELLRATERSGELLLWRPDVKQVQRRDGEVLFSLLQSEAYGPAGVATNPRQPPLAVWSPAYDSSQGFPGYYLTTGAQDGTQVGIQSRSWIHPTGWLANDLIVVTLERWPDPLELLQRPRNVMRPSLVDFATGVAHPIRGVFDAPPFYGTRNLVQAVLRGTAVRARTPDCLPVRDRWSNTAAVLQCVSPGALRVTGERRYGNAQEWRAVVLPDGRTGWAPLLGLTSPPGPLSY